MERRFRDERYQNADNEVITERGTENPSPPSLLLKARLYRFVRQTWRVPGESEIRSRRRTGEERQRAGIGKRCDA